MCVDMGLRFCVLSIEKICQIKTTAETGCTLSRSLQASPGVTGPSHTSSSFDCYLNKIW